MIRTDVPVCECGECGKVWLPEAWAKAIEQGEGSNVPLPARCARCKARTWNGGRQVPAEAPRAQRAAPKPQPRPRYTPAQARPVYCRHGLNAATCARCRELAGPSRPPP